MAQAELSTRLVQLYDDYRTALMNQKYFGYRLSRLRRYNSRMELALALGTSTAVASWTIWKSGPGAHVWPCIMGVTAVIAILKPILNFGAKTENCGALFIGYGDVFYDLQEIVRAVETQRNLPDALDRAHQRSIDRLRNLAKSDEASPDRKLLEQSQDEVDEEIPARALWMPQGGKAHDGTAATGQ